MILVEIYAPSRADAAELAATMNLSIRHWEYVGESMWGDTWADVGLVMENYEELEGKMQDDEQRNQ